MVKWNTMEIKRNGKNCIVLKGKKEIVTIDPSEKEKISGRIVVHTDNGQVRLDDQEIIIVAGPGEYEIGGVEITGISAGNNLSFYTIVIDGIIVGVLGEMKEELSEKKQEKVNSVDVLIASINNGGGLSGKRFVDLAKNWGANILIPVGYERGDDNSKKFLDDTDNEGLAEVDFVKVEKDDLPEGSEAVLLKSF